MDDDYKHKILDLLQTCMLNYPGLPNANLEKYFQAAVDLKQIKEIPDSLPNDARFPPASNNMSPRERIKDVLYDTGMLFIEQRPKVAIPFLHRVIEIDPHDFECCQEIGIACATAGMPDSAIYYFDKILQSQPDDFECHCLKGDCYRSMGKINEARVSYKELSKLRQMILE